MKVSNLQKMIDDIMDNFQFRKVEDMMNFLNWKIYVVDGEYCIPDEYQLRVFARKMIYDLIEDAEISVENYHWRHCGPFEVRICKEGGFIYSVQLKFVVESFDSQHLEDVSE